MQMKRGEFLKPELIASVPFSVPLKHLTQRFCPMRNI